MRSLGLGLGLGRSRLTIIGGGGNGGGSPGAVLLITDDTTHAAATNTRDAIEAGGHSVTLQTASGVDETFDFSPYDLIATTRLDGASSALTHIRTAMDGGKPVLIGIGSGSAGSGQTVPSTALDLTGTVHIVSEIVDEEEIIDTSHEITSGYSTGLITLFDGENWGAGIEASDYVGDALATGDDTSLSIHDKETLVAIEAGTSDLEGVALAARAVVWLNLYGGQNDYNAAGEQLVADILDWLLS